MPKLLTVDGPEKAGKGTLLTIIRDTVTRRGWMTMSHHWRGQQVDHWIHKRILMQQVEAAKMLEYTTGRPCLIIWDRSQASEAIYSQLLNRGGELASNPLLGEFMYGRIQQALGPRLILLGPDVQTLQLRRDITDHPVDVTVERETYRKYGADYNWEVLENPHTLEYVQNLATTLIARIEAFPELDVSTYVGPPEASRICIRNKVANEPVPFASKLTCDLVLKGGPKIMQYGYATVDCPREILLKAKEIAVPDRSPLLFNFARYYLDFNPNQVRFFKNVFN